jgi:hypothetical protein
MISAQRARHLPALEGASSPRTIPISDVLAKVDGRRTYVGGKAGRLTYAGGKAGDALLMPGGKARPFACFAGRSCSGHSGREAKFQNWYA